MTSSKVIYNSDSATQKTVSDIRTLGINHEGNGAYYQFSIQCNDGVENSSIVKSNIMYVTKIPLLTGLYNKSDFSNIANFSINYYGLNISVKKREVEENGKNDNDTRGDNRKQC